MPVPPRSPLQPARRRRRTPPHVYARRRLTAIAIALLAIAGVASGISSMFGGEDASTRNTAQAEQTATPTPTPEPPPELPRGGRRLFPDYRVVAYYGHPGAAELGILGIGRPSQAVAKLKRQAKPYARKTRPVMPTLELLSTIVTPSPGEDGKHRIRQPRALIDRYHRAARKAKGLLLLDIQPGTSDFLTEARALRRWLKEPDVGLALDPEWRMPQGQIPGQAIGSVSAAEVNRTSQWLSSLTRKYRLPQKLFLIHQFTNDMIRGRSQLEDRENLAMVLNVDGFGGRGIKTAKYREFTKDRRFRIGFKLFYREDAPELMTPKQVMALQPRPDVVIYE